MRALWVEMERRGIRVEGNRISRGSRACLFNSYNFNFRRLRRQAARRGCRMVHRVDGPLAVYRGSDDGTDARILDINRALAHVTVFQSQFSLNAHRELGLEFAEPSVIMNAADPSLFHAKGREEFDASRKIRLVSVSWSDNPNKGATIYKWLDEHLDWGRYEYTFIGRVTETFRHIRHMQPVDSHCLADHLRCSDIYITASRHDPCSNSLIEALSCGLPCLHLNSGGHAEIAGDAGLAFGVAEEIPDLLVRLVNEYGARRRAIRVPSIGEVADAYLALLLGGGRPPSAMAATGEVLMRRDPL